MSHSAQRSHQSCQASRDCGSTRHTALGLRVECVDIAGVRTQDCEEDGEPQRPVFEESAQRSENRA